uniref:Uncharacterized protein n=1 Tax=Oryza rufipogon TaxID=4529 RepID=A0A0E0PYT6_ORYRU
MRRRHCFDPRRQTLGNTLTSKEVFTRANSNNQRLLHVGDIDRTSKLFAIFLLLVISIDMNENMMDGCYCATSSSSLYHTATSFHDSIVDY